MRINPFAIGRFLITGVLVVSVAMALQTGEACYMATTGAALYGLIAEYMRKDAYAALYELLKEEIDDERNR